MGVLALAAKFFSGNKKYLQVSLALPAFLSLLLPILLNFPLTKIYRQLFLLISKNNTTFMQPKKATVKPSWFY